MEKNQKIINIAVIAHVDAGKSTLVDAFLAQTNVFRANEEIIDCVMDSDQIERERGITIYSKNCSINYKDYKINIVDTPGHADFSSEVERIIRTVDTVVLLVDSSEGPMPQTRFVLQKSLELGLNPILLINKIDKKDARPVEVQSLVFDLFAELNATEEQLDFTTLYGVAKHGIVKKELEDSSEDLTPLFETIIKQVQAYPDLNDEPAQLQISSLAYDEYIGRLGIGRLYRGKLKEGQEVAICQNDGKVIKQRITALFVYKGLKRIPVKEAFCGDIVVIAGISNVSIGFTICDKEKVEPLPAVKIEEPTLSMNFLVNKSPFAGRSGKYITSRNIKERLDKELEVNVGLKVEPLTESSVDGFIVSGRGELHLSVLIENMRREGYELAVSKPEVIIMKDEATNELLEPLERVIVTVREEYSGSVISKLSLRKGQMENMEINNGQVRLEYTVPTRGLIGYRQEFINDTRGEGILVRRFEGFTPYKGAMQKRANGVMISQELGTTVAYSLNALEERGTLFLPAGIEVYEGMIVGLHSRNNDLVVNPCKGKKLSNVRASGSDDAIKLTPPITFTLEDALEFIEQDELVEVTPDAIRLRKKILAANLRKQSEKQTRDY